jgi:hypothetical protein
LEALKAAATPDSLRAKIWEIMRNHLADSDGILCEAGGGPPRSQGRASDAYADALFEWLAQARGRHDFDSPEGRAVEIVGLCAHAISALDRVDPAFRLGFVLGYGISQKNHLLVREFGDGPALARESALQAARAEGGNARAQQNAERDRKLRAAFAAAKAKNPSLTPNGWANDNASEYHLSADRVGKILLAGSVSKP